MQPWPVPHAPGFIDQTLLPGRPPDVPGPLAASTFVRGAVPDMHCEVQQLIMAGDRVVTHLHFTGHFTGTFKGVQGKGQVVDFMATDIYRIANGKIAENWHLEDNLTFLQNLGIVARQRPGCRVGWRKRIASPTFDGNQSSTGLRSHGPFADATWRVRQ